MAVLDVIVLIVLAGGFWRGWRRGLAREIAGLLSLVAAILLATFAAWLLPLADVFESALGVERGVGTLLAWGSVWLAVSIVLLLLARRKREDLEENGVEASSQRLGAVVGAIKAFLLCIALAIAIAAPSDRLRAYILDTHSGRAMASTVRFVLALLPEEAARWLEQDVEKGRERRQEAEKRLGVEGR